MGTQDFNKSDDFQDPEVSNNLRGRFYGEHLGQVVNRDDPLMLGRIKAHVPSLFPGDPKNRDLHTHWLRPKGHWLRVPPLGGTVIVTFENGIPASGSYAWGWFKGKDAETSAVASSAKGMGDPTYEEPSTVVPAGAGFPDDYEAPETPADPATETPPRYPDNFMYVSPGGHLFEEDNSVGEPRLRYRHPTGTTVLIDPAGNVQVHSQGGVRWRSEGDFTLHMARGATYRVECEDGPSQVIGPTGCHTKSNLITLQGRRVANNREPI